MSFYIFRTQWKKENFTLKKIYFIEDGENMMHLSNWTCIELVPRTKNDVNNLNAEFQVEKKK